MRSLGLIAALLLAAPGCAPTDGYAPPGGEPVRRCFSDVSARLISVQPGRVYVRTRTGDALELSGEDACLQAAVDGTLDLGPAVGPDTGDLCLGQDAHLQIVSHAAGRRTCNVRLERAVPYSEINQLPGYRRP